MLRVIIGLIFLVFSVGPCQNLIYRGTPVQGKGLYGTEYCLKHVLNRTCRFDGDLQRPILFGERLDINVASHQALVDIPGIGPSKAKKIVLYREREGDFQVLKDLTKVSGIGDKTLQKIEPYITIR